MRSAAARIGVGLAVLLASCSEAAPQPSPSPTGPRLATIEVGRNASQVALGAGSAWVANSGDGTLSEIDSATNRLKTTLRIGDTGVMRSRGCAPGTVHSAPDGSFAVRQCDLPSAVVVASGSVWVTKDDERLLLRLDPRSHRVLNRISIEVRPFLMASGAGSIWVTDYENDALARVDIATNSLVKVFRGLAHGPSGVAVGAGGVWIANRRQEVVTRIDPETNEVAAVIPVGHSPLAIAAGDAVWVKNEYDTNVARIDPATNSVVATVAVGPKEGRDGVDSIALDGVYAWITGMRLAEIDTRINQVVRRLNQDATTVTAPGDGTLWVTDIAGRVIRLHPS
jgi:YVTN family beta-propeller protein